jgi:hypothetical protein
MFLSSKILCFSLFSIPCIYHIFFLGKMENNSRPVNPTMIYITAGNLTYNGNEGVKRYVVSVILHDKYNPNNMDNDIAILKVLYRICL